MTEYNIYKHRQATMRGYPSSMLGAVGIHRTSACSSALGRFRWHESCRAHFCSGNLLCWFFCVSIISQWLSGWLEPVKSNSEFESLFLKMCVGQPESQGGRHFKNRDEVYRIPSTLVMVGRSCVDKVRYVFIEKLGHELGLASVVSSVVNPC